MVRGVKRVNWLLYRLHCHNNGLTEGDLKTFINYMEGRLKNECNNT